MASTSMGPHLAMKMVKKSSSDFSEDFLAASFLLLQLLQSSPTVCEVQFSSRPVRAASRSLVIKKIV